MAKSYDMRLKILEIGEVVNVTDNFKKREVVGIVEGEYPEYYKFEFVQKNVGIPEDFMENTYATIHFNLKGRKVEGKGKKKEDAYFVSLQGWKMEA